jgi:hypothetical protein
VKVLRLVLVALLLLIALVDVVAGYHLWYSGWPKRVVVIDGTIKGTAYGTSTPG